MCQLDDETRDPDHVIGHGVLAWAALKMRRYRAYWWYMLATIMCRYHLSRCKTLLRMAAEI